MFDLREISERITRVRRMGHAVGVDLDSAIGEGAGSPNPRRRPVFAGA